MIGAVHNRAYMLETLLLYTNSNGTTTTYYDYPYNIPREPRGNMFSAPIFSLAGIVQITSRASLFFDSMLAFGLGMGEINDKYNIYWWV